MMSLYASQITTAAIVLDWITDAPDPAAGFSIDVAIDGAAPVHLATISGTLRRFYDSSGLWTAPVPLEYRITDLDSAVLASIAIQAADLDSPFTYGPPRPDATTARYTSLETVRRRLNIPDTVTKYDADLLEAIIGAEIAIDFELGRSFPDTGTNPEITVVPVSVTMLATSAAIAVYKAGDAPFGTAGSDDMFGALSVADVASQTIRRSPLLRGLQVSFGIG